MAFTLTGTRDEPVVASAGNTPDFAADLSGISTFFAVRSLRRKTTIANVMSATGVSAGDALIATAAPGMIFWYDGSKFNVTGVAKFDTLSAANTGIPSPTQGMRRRIATKTFDEEYLALYNSSTNPTGAAVAGWYPVTGNMPFISMKRSAVDPVSLANNAVTQLTDYVADVTVGSGSSTAGQITIGEPGRYRITAAYECAPSATGARLIYVNKNSATYTTNTLAGSSVVGGSGANATPYCEAIATLAAGDILRMYYFQNSGGGLALQGAGASAGDAVMLFFRAQYLGPA